MDGQGLCRFGHDHRCASIRGRTEQEQETRAYDCDITYATNNELGFDYLRDNMKSELNDMFQRGHNFAIVDEVDSILIDEARTPLIISGPAEDRSELYQTIDKLIPLVEEDHYTLDEKTRNVTFTDEGNEFLEEQLRAHGLLPEGQSLYDPESTTVVHHVNQGLRAHKLFTKDKDYIVRDNEVVLIDEFTGRMMAGRRLSDGLHQAIEAKEGCEIKPENVTLASVTFQNYFRLYNKLGGMTGTALPPKPKNSPRSTVWAWSKCPPTSRLPARTMTTASIVRGLRNIRPSSTRSKSPMKKASRFLLVRPRSKNPRCSARCFRKKS